MDDVVEEVEYINYDSCNLCDLCQTQKLGSFKADTTNYFVVWWVLLDCSIDHFPY